MAQVSPDPRFLGVRARLDMRAGSGVGAFIGPS